MRVKSDAPGNPFGYDLRDVARRRSKVFGKERSFRSKTAARRAAVFQNMGKAGEFRSPAHVCPISPHQRPGTPNLLTAKVVPTTSFVFLVPGAPVGAPFFYRSKSDRDSYKIKNDRNTAAKNQRITFAVSRNIRAGNADTEFRGTTKTRRSEFRFPTTTRQPPLRR